MVAEAQTKDQTKSNKEFENLLNEDFKDRKLKEQEIVKATVTEVTKKFVILDLKAKQEAMIPVEEFKQNNELEELKIGSKVDVYLERIESYKGEIIVSREKAKRMKAWTRMEKVFETGEELNGIITSKIKGGYLCVVDGLPGFMPSSQIDTRPLKNVSHLLNTPIKVIATRIDKKRGNVCFSRRQVLEKSKNAELKDIFKDLNEGDIIDDAKVRNITSWGIFLDVRGADCLLHVSDLAFGRVSKPSDLATIGQTMRVKLTKVDRENLRLSASVKALTEDPYKSLEQNYEVGKIYPATITKLMDYGAFARLQDSIEGLIHSSELDFKNRNIEPSKVLSVSQQVKVKIVSIDKEQKRISLSYKDNGEFENPWNKIKERLNTVTDFTISNVTDKAIFGDIKDLGLTAMCHYRELSYSENSEDLKKYKKGQVIKAKIIEIKDDKIRFSVRALEKDPMDYFKENKKKEGDIITTTVLNSMKNGVLVFIGTDKKLTALIKKSQLAKEPSNQRPEIFQAGNKLDAAIVELDIPNRKFVLSVKHAEAANEKVLMKKYGKDAKMGATLKDVFSGALNILGKKKKTKKD